MNQNLSPLQRAARNLFAGETGITDPATVELAFLNPTTAALTEDMAAKLLEGPFGSFTSDDGYVRALSEVRELFSNVVIAGTVSEATRAIVDSLVTRLDDEVADRIATVTKKPSGTDGFQAAFEALEELFGVGNVRVVKL